MVKISIYSNLDVFRSLFRDKIYVPNDRPVINGTIIRGLLKSPDPSTHRNNSPKANIVPTCHNWNLQVDTKIKTI
jgi:hypothetical protein